MSNLRSRKGRKAGKDGKKENNLEENICLAGVREAGD